MVAYNKNVRNNYCVQTCSLCYRMHEIKNERDQTKTLLEDLKRRSSTHEKDATTSEQLNSIINAQRIEAENVSKLLFYPKIQAKNN